MAISVACDLVARVEQHRGADEELHFARGIGTIAVGE